MNRPRLVVVAVVVLALVWGVLPRIGAPPFAAHMTMHMSVVAIVAPLLALGVAGGRLDPVRRAPAVFSPLVASAIELVAVWAWHAPALHHEARHRAWAFALEQATFLAAGWFLWMSALGGGREARRARAIASVVGLLLTSMHMTLLGALLALGTRELYPHGHAHGGALAPLHDGGALAPLHDQQVGGVIMLFVGGVVYLAGGLALCGDALLRDRAAKERST